MRKRGSGSIINISSIYGLIGSTGSTAYHGQDRDHSGVAAAFTFSTQSISAIGKITPVSRDVLSAAATFDT